MPEARRDNPNFFRGAAGASVGLLATAVVFGGGGYLAARHESQQSEQFEKERNELEANTRRVLEDDDFDMNWVNDWSPNQDITVSLDLGSCSIDEVTADTVEDENGTIVDVKNYQFSGHSLSERHTSTRNPGGTYSYTTGVPVTFRFDNRQDLEENILSSEPCKTLLEGDFQN